MIQITNLKKSFGEKTVINIPNLTINKGELVGLVGNNGAGKTTLFRIILDLLDSDEGTVSLSFSQSEPVNPAKSEIWKNFTSAYIDEGFLIDFLTPEEYFQFIGQTANLSDEDLKARVAPYETLAQGEIFGQKKLIRDFSAGNKQKIGIIAALINQPQLLILDEPFNFLDPSGQNILKKILLQYNQEMGATIIISSHNLQHTTDISSRIVLLEHGVVIKDLPNTHGAATEELKDYFELKE